jgi:hypothetical protein
LRNISPMALHDDQLEAMRTRGESEKEKASAREGVFEGTS